MESDKKFDKLESCTGKYRIELVTRTKTRAGIGLIDLISQPVLWIKLLLLVTKMACQPQFSRGYISK